MPDLIYWSEVWDHPRSDIYRNLAFSRCSVWLCCCLSSSVQSAWSSAVQAMGKLCFWFHGFWTWRNPIQSSAGTSVPTKSLQTQQIQSHHLCRGIGSQPCQDKACCLMLGLVGPGERADPLPSGPNSSLPLKVKHWQENPTLIIEKCYPEVAKSSWYSSPAGKSPRWWSWEHPGSSPLTPLQVGQPPIGMVLATA